MSVSEDLEFIGEQALTLTERLRVGLNANACLDDSPEALLNRWTKAFSSADRSAFQRRLKWDDLTEESLVCGKMGQQSCPPDAPWLNTLISATGFCSQVLDDFGSSNLEELSWIDAKQEIFLCQLWLPFVRLARTKLRKSLAHPDSIGEQAWRQLQVQLIHEIASTGEQALYQRYCQFRSNSPNLTNQNDRSLLDQFIVDSLQNELISLFRPYPVLARQVCRLVDTWIDCSAELLNRLHSDRSEISRLFNQKKPLGMLDEVKPALSDRHEGGRRVTALSFSSGLKLIYKPRSVSQEYAFNRLICWLGERGLNMPPPHYEVLDKSTYGWVSYISQQACESMTEVSEYFYKSGMLTALIYILNGNDCHMDNVIATRDGPLLIDLESLLQPLRNATENNDVSAFSTAQHQLDQSVLASGLLQYLCVAPDGSVTDSSGFRGKGNHTSQIKQRFWKHNNSDLVELEYRLVKIKPMQNLVSYRGRVQSPEDHVDALIQGFNCLYQFVQQQYPNLIQDDGPLQWFKTAYTRIIFRPSNDYALLLHALTAPRFQKNGLDRSLVIESMGRVFSKSPSKPALWALHRDEKQCLENMDIPYFSLAADTKNLTSRNGECDFTTLSRSGYDDLLQRLETLSEKDRQAQEELIRSSLATDSAHDWVSGSISNGSSLRKTQPLTDDEILHDAEKIADQIWERAISGAQGAVTWLSPTFSKRENRSERGAAYYLYSGGCGIALFQAALARMTGRQHYRQQVEASVKPISILLESESIEVLLEKETLGVCNGIGSIVYCLLCIGQLLDDKAYIDLATQMAAFISPTRITQDRRLDIEGGCAGAILALTALYRHSGDPLLLDQAKNCGQHLLAQHQQTPDGWGWLNYDGLMLAGLAHGAGGIALAFLRLYKQCSEQHYLDAAIEAIRYEDNLFCTARGNWPVLTKNAETGVVDSSISMMTWCHGAPGIALARLEALELGQYETQNLRFETAVELTQNCDLTMVDHLCCGNLGRADSLLTLGLILDRQELTMQARLIANGVIRRMREQGHFRLQANSTQGAYFNPGFFRGLSGIGYTLLRMIDPQCLPTILLFNTAEKSLHPKEAHHA